MRIVTATRLRSTLYKTLQDLSSGGKVRIRSKWGAFIVQNETDSQASRPKKKALEPLLNGTINEDFDNADLVLRKHIRVPS